MEEKRYGKIVNIASIAGVSNMSAHNPAYAAAKGGVVLQSLSNQPGIVAAKQDINWMGSVQQGVIKQIQIKPIVVDNQLLFQHFRAGSNFFVGKRMVFSYNQIGIAGK